MNIERDRKSLRITKGRLNIISHSFEEPWIFAGHGSAEFKMHLGNFNIEEEIGEKSALRYFSITDADKGIAVTFSNNSTYSVKVLLYEEENRVRIRFIESSSGINRLWLRIPSNRDESIYGCGEQFSYFNLRGRKFPLWVSEQGVGRNKKTYPTFMADCRDGGGGDYYSTYYPQPTFISSDKYYCHVVDSSYMEFNFKNERYHELYIWGIPEEVIFGVEDSFTELMADITDLLGRQIELPEWVYDGVWIGMQGGTETVLKKLDNAIKCGLKVSGIWAQDWEGKRITSFGKRLMWNWQWDRNLYPDLDNEIERLNERGIKFLGYINPYLAVEGNIFKEADSLGYLVKNRLGGTYTLDAGEFLVGIVDLTNPEAFKWYKGVIKTNMIELGLSGWMADFGEYLPTDTVLYNGISAEKMHNMWPVLWARCNREAIEEAGKLGENVFFTRSGYSQSGRYTTLMWAGDQNVDWSLDDGLPSVITAALSLGLSGCGLHHSDIGGYTTLFGMKRTKELFMRWAEMSAFTPVMRTHEGNRPDDNWQFDSDKETLLHFARMSRVYTTLSPYIKEAVKENSKIGLPVMRPLFMHYEECKEAYSMNYEFLLGRDLLVAPVYEAGRVGRSVFLPPDTWAHIWTGCEYNEGVHDIISELGYPPVFYRKDSSWAGLFKEVGSL